MYYENLLAIRVHHTIINTNILFAPQEAVKATNNEPISNLSK